MKISKIIILIIVILANNKFVSSQEELDSLYGVNPILYNGQKFNSYLSSHAKGHQFLLSEEFINGTIDISGKHFEKVHINYDVYNQEIPLKVDLNKRTLFLKLFKDRVERFELDGQFFEVLKDDNLNNSAIYQVIGTDKIQILYNWNKTLKVSTKSLEGTHVFSKPMKKMYVRINDQMFWYWNKRTFMSNFDESTRKAVKRYIKSNKINVRKSSHKKNRRISKIL